MSFELVAGKIVTMKDKKPTLFIMSGLPFSGKSVLSILISRALKIDRISFDKTLEELVEAIGPIPGEDELEKWEYVNEICEASVRNQLLAGRSVVYDDAGSNFDDREKMRIMAKEAGASSKTIYVDMTKSEAEKRRRAGVPTDESEQGMSDEEFEKVASAFEAPSYEDDVVKYDPKVDPEEWIVREFGTKAKK